MLNDYNPVIKMTDQNNIFSLTSCASSCSVHLLVFPQAWLHVISPLLPRYLRLAIVDLMWRPHTKTPELGPLEQEEVFGEQSAPLTEPSKDAGEGREDQGRAQGEDGVTTPHASQGDGVEHHEAAPISDGSIRMSSSPLELSDRVSNAESESSKP